MKKVKSFPYRVRVIENIFIPMRDGARLAARVWMPEVAKTEPLPAILEYIPYRKRDNTRGRDEPNHGYLSSFGYVCVRVDLRGSGDSDGVLVDEYTHQEQQDGLDVINWLAEQEWCDGNVGMMGISWGGFNCLHLAAHRPPALKAVISACSSDDLYADNMHYMGGCLLGDNLSEASIMLAFNSLPPDPRIVGERWRDMWLERLEGSGLWLEPWLRHQRRSAYWSNNSVCEYYDAIDCAVMAVGGWADGFTNTVFRLLQNLNVPRLGLIGPWGHKYPHHAVPNPAIGFLQEAVRWWDYWLKGIDTGIMEEPMLRAWMQYSEPPREAYEARSGRWVAEPEWPSKHIINTKSPLFEHHIGKPGSKQSEDNWLSVQSPLSLGMAAGKWCSYTATPDLPGDQREEDGGAITFDSDPLTEPLEMFGAGWVDLEIAADQEVAMVAVRLSDVGPDGTATRVTYGLLNLTHRSSDDNPEPLKRGKPYHVRVPLNGVGQRIPAGNLIRLSISSSYWPLAWPAPEPTMLSINPAGSSLTLPLRPERADANTPHFEGPEEAPDMPMQMLKPREFNWWLTKDLANNSFVLEVINDHGQYRIEETGTDVTRDAREWYTIKKRDVNSARGETYTYRAFNRDDWNVDVETRTILTSDIHDFKIHAQLDAYEEGERIYSQNWAYTIPRDLV